MVRRVRAYDYNLVVETDGDAVHVFVPSLRGCHTFGDTEEEMLAAIREAAQVHIESLWFDQLEIPPSDPDLFGAQRVKVVNPWATD